MRSEGNKHVVCWNNVLIQRPIDVSHGFYNVLIPDQGDPESSERL